VTRLKLQNLFSDLCMHTVALHEYHYVAYV